jgi:hypothetical protein
VIEQQALSELKGESGSKHLFYSLLYV